ncbi:MAG TPA: hypothetical protein VGB24_05035 [Longimicrobium sp.]|jgi:hypothetical protein|uniref:hypothetical protein n=1 Tax=Longimicrobium sp. TaxID=2029185 RepID=UPI002ED7A137
MKCIYCGTDSKLRQRTEGRCPGCRHPFAFEPTRDPYKVTDGQFENAMERVSGNGKVLFTERHLWYEFNRRWMKPGFWRSLYGKLAFAGAAQPPRPPRIAFPEWERRYLRRWKEVHGDVAALLPVRQVAAPALPREVPADVAAFSFDRAVVTDQWETAQVLVANRFHFEHNCAVLSRDGYPDGIAGTVKEMLRRNPRLTVFALHDASPGGCLLPLTLREQEWFPNPAVRIVDLGLRPQTVRRLRIPALAGSPRKLPPRLGEVLPPDDVAWLARGHTGELAALHPAQVLRAAYQGIVAAGPNDGSAPSGGDGGGGGDTYYGGGVIWVGDLGGGTDTAAVDGFG